ncbi:uncharacterized protein VTP21DRAFT_10514 [Calcarisporiella thermophila]|uniref:uncharacterized protein n=1 Tax=Calcarisporiella thermophila TaxID=911321 RepID=UPI0037432736
MDPASLAEYHKRKGNTLFKRHDFELAINEYSIAIIKNPIISTYYTNRALCELKLEKYDAVVNDCQKAIELDPNTVKGYYFMGQAFLEMKRFVDAIAYLKKAYHLALDQQVTYTSDIVSALLKARKAKWDADETLRVQRESALLRYMRDLINQERQKQLDNVDKEDPDHLLIIDTVNTEHDERLSELQVVFERSEERLQRREIPESFIDPISFNIMHDPVITPSGITYERTALKEHIKVIGSFDPLTRAPLNERNLISNLALKEAIEDFLRKNGWAADY